MGYKTTWRIMKFLLGRLFKSFLNETLNVFNISLNINTLIRKLPFSKIISIIISYSLIYSQILFSFLLTQSLILTIPSHSAYADAIATAPQNIEHNPIDYIEIDNSIAIDNGDTNGNGNNAYLDRAQNGTPLVNINNATTGGVSANYYKDLNVTNENLILNNYKGESVETNLGGVIYGNPNFNGTNGRAADIILNEITTNRVSNINGYIEVAGKKADVIIANPNGIMVSGGGFLNTSRLSLITGKSGACSNGTTNCGTLDSNGNLNPFLLTDTGVNPNAIITVVGRNVTDANGNVVAYNLGIDATNINYLDLVSRVIKINGNIIGSDNTEINVKTGNDKSYYNRDANGNSNTNGFNVISKDNTSDTNKPEFAIDSTAFGGVQAGRINFIATEKGIAVKTRSDLIATVSDINFDVNGNINLEETGSLYAKNNVNLNNKTNTTNNPNKETDNTSSDRTIINNSYIVAGNNVNIDTNNLNNTNISSTETIINQQTRETTTTVRSTDTQTSLIYSQNNITINSNNLDNSNTTDTTNLYTGIFSGNDLYLNIANTLDNNSGSITAIGNLNIFGENNTANNLLNNQNGKITSNGIIQIKSKNLNNSNNGYIFGKNGINFDLANLDNNNGTIESDGGINITNSLNNSYLDTLDNTNGMILSTSYLSLVKVNSTNSIINTNGNISSNGDIIIDVLADYIINGTIYSNSDISITALNITNNSSVIAGNNITFNSTGNITNGSTTNSAASIIAINNLVFNILRDTTDGTTDTITTTDPITGLTTTTPNTLYVNSGSLYNYGKITVGNDLNIDAENSIYNYKSIGSYGDLTIKAKNNLYNYANSLIISTSNINLGIDNTIYNYYATIWADQNINITGYDNNSYNSNLNNVSANIESYNGSINIKSKNLVNQRDETNMILVNNDYVYSPFVIQEHDSRYYNTGGSFGWTLLRLDQPKYADIYTSIYSYWFVDGYSQSSYIKVGKFTDRYLNPNSVESVIRAKNDITIDADYNVGTVHNKGSSIISRQGNISITAQNFYNDAYAINDTYVHECHTYEASTCITLTHDSYGNLYEIPITPYVIVGNTLVAQTPNASRPSIFVTGQVHAFDLTKSWVDSYVKAAGSITINSKNTYNGNRAVQEGVANMTGGYDIYTGSEFSEAVQSAKENGYIFTTDVDFSMGGLFKKNTEPVEQSQPQYRYLYETNSEFLDTSAFIGSDYFLKRLGIDLDKFTSKFLGDAAYEQMLVQATISKITNYDYLGTNDINTQMQILFDNAYDEYNLQGDLEIGKPLTAEQIKNLKKDMLWLVEQEVDGEKVLVPVIYFAQSTLDTLNGSTGSVIAANNVILNSENNITNTGIIKAKNSLVLTSSSGNIVNGYNTILDRYSTLEAKTINIETPNNFVNSGSIYNSVAMLIDAGNIQNANKIDGTDITLISNNDINNMNLIRSSSTLTLYANNDINNNDGTISSGGDMQLIAGNDILMESSTQRNMKSNGYFDTIYKVSTVESGGSLVMQAGNNIDVKAGAISAAEDALIYAGNDINIETVVLEDKESTSWKKGHSTTTIDTNVSSNIDIGGNLVMSSGNDTNIIGSNVNVTGNASIQTGGDLNIESAENTYHYESYTKKKGTFSSKSSSTVIDSTTNVSSNINIGGNLNVNSDGSINLLASNMSSGKDMTLQADKNLNIISGQDTYSRTDKSSSSKMVSSKMSTNIHQTTTQVQSNLTAGGDLTTFSGDDTNIIASNLQSTSGAVSLVAGQYLDSNGEIAVNTDANINILSAYNTTYDYSKTVKAGLKLNDIREIAKAMVVDTITNYYNLSTGLTAASVLSYETKTDADSTLTKTLVSSNINAENGINIQSSGDTTLLASKLKSQNGDISISAGTVTDKDGNVIKNDTASINILSGSNSTMSDSEHTTGKLGLTFTNTGVDVGKYNSNENANMNTTNVASELTADNGNVILNAQNDINILASKLKATNGSIGLTAENGNINISSTNDYSSSKSQSNESTVGLNLASGNGSIGFNFAEFMDTKNSTIKTTNVASELTAENGDIIINAKNDIGIMGSNLTTTNGSIGLTTEDGDVTITSGRNYYDSETQTMEGSTGFGIDKNLTITNASFLDINEDHGTSTNVASNITANGGSVIVNSGDNILVQASDINGDNGVSLTSQGNTEILAGLDSEWSSYDRKEGVSQLAFETTKSELSAKAGLKYEQESNSSNKTTVVGSNVVSNSGSVIGNSEDNIVIAGSNVIANQNIDLTAKNDLSILSTQEVETNKSSLFMIDVGLKAGIYTNILTALDTLKSLADINVGDAVGGAAGIVTQITQTTDLDEILSGNEEGVNATMKGLEAYQLFKQGPSASADISVNVEIEGSKHKDTTTNSIGSLLLAGNDIGLTTQTGDINIEGSVLQANNDITLDSAKDINIKSAENTYSSKDSGYNLEVDVSVIGQGFSINGGINGAKSSATTHNNSTISAGNDFNSTSKNDTNIIGANITADNNVNIDVGNNLTIQSEQNKSDSKNFSVNLGGGTSGSGGNANAGFQYGYTDRDWVDNQTSIIGNNSVNVNVGTATNSEGNTNIVGAVIASGTYDENGNFTDNGNLSLDTKTLTYSNIYDEDEGLQVGASAGFGNQTKQDGGAKQSGSFGFNYGSHDKEQTTYATIGNGTITIAGNEVNETNNNSDLIRDLNRDINNSQVITKDQTVDTIEGNVKFGIEDKSAKDALQSWVRADQAITGAVKQAAKNAGNDELAKDISKLETDITKGMTVASGTVLNVLTAMYDVISDEKTNISDLSSQVSNSQMVLNKQQDYDRDTINELGVDDKTIKEIKTATNGDANVYYDETDVDENGNQKYGKHDNDTNESYINAANGTASDTKLFVETLGHELTHDNTDSEVVADNVGDYAVTSWILGNFLAGTEIAQATTKYVVNSNGTVSTVSNKTSSDSWLNNQVSTVEGRQDLINSYISSSNVTNESDSTVVKVDYGNKASKITLTSKLEEQKQLREKVLEASLKGEEIDLTAEEITLLLTSVEDLAEQTREEIEEENTKDIMNNMGNYVASGGYLDTNLLLSLTKIIIDDQNSNLNESDFNNITTGTVISAVNDSDTNIYDQYGNKIGETLFADDYVLREGESINFDKTYTVLNRDTKINDYFNMSDIIGTEGLYGYNAELMVQSILNFEGDKSYVYVDSKNYLTTGIGTYIDSISEISDISLTKNGTIYSSDSLINVYNELKSVVSKNSGYSADNINEELAKTGYSITNDTKFMSFINDITDSATELQNKFTNYDSYPTSAKNALLDMEYNMGGKFIDHKTSYADGWPKLYSDVKSENWESAAKDSYRKDVGDQDHIRNVFVKEQFKNATSSK